MTIREYRIPGARFSLLDALLLVQYRSGIGVTISLGGGKPQPYRAKGPVWIEVDDGTGKQPVVEGEFKAASDDFGVVLTELVFRGEVKAWPEGEVLVVSAAGEPKIVGGHECLPLGAGDLGGAVQIAWNSNHTEGDPHPPI